MPRPTLIHIRWLILLLLVLLLSGCSINGIVEALHLRSLVTFFTAGPVADYERNIMLFTFGVMLFVLVPVISLTLWFAWRYRAGNNEATFWPNWHQSHFLEWFLWGGPLVIIVILGTMTWITTFDLDPYEPIDSDAKPIEVQAIAMDWKWLFIYPDYNVASVNELAAPVDVPISLHLTSATVMNGFMIPRLGGQIMAMSGMATQLHLMATQTGSFFGKNYQYSGDGFSDMTFQTRITSPKKFDQWIAKARSASDTLDISAYEKLLQPGKNDAISFYSSVRPELFKHVIKQFNSAGGNPYQVDHATAETH